MGKNTQGIHPPHEVKGTRPENTRRGPCRALDSILNKIAEDHQGKVKVVAVDIDVCPEVSKKYGIRSVPTLLVFNQGHKAAQHVGLTSRESILMLLGM